MRALYEMDIKPINQVNFGIYKGIKRTGYGQCTHGEYKGYNIDIYYDKKDKTKLVYVSDQLKNWVKSKLEYFDKGKKKTVISENGRL